MRRDKKEVRSGQEAGFSAEPTRIDMQSSPRNLDETARQTSAGRRIVGVLASGLGRRSSSHYSHTDSPNSPSLLVKRQFAFPILAVLAVAALGLWLLLPGGALRAQESGAIEYAEKRTGSVATYTAVDPEGAAITSWTLDGDDADDFKIEDGVLSFKKSPNYEKGTDGDQNNDGDTDDTGEEASDNIYMVTVQATDATKRVGMKEVTVEVTNVEEGGSMRLSAVQPQAGTSFYVIDEDEDADATGTQIKDEDGVTSSIKWQWSRSRSKTTGFADIDKATNPAYTPKDTDSGYYLRVTASYTDREGPDKSARAISSYAVQLAPSNNAAPKFDDDQDPDTTGDQADAPRSIAENTPKGVDIGSPVEAEDLNPGKLTYTLEGTNDEDHFDIDRKTGQLKTKTKLDREDAEDLTDRDGNADGLQLQVTVRATDPSGDPHDATATDRADYSATVNVLITVEDLAEDPQITASETDNMLGGFAEETAMTTAIATFEAVVEDSGSVNRWSLTGPDAGKFDIAEPDNATDLDTVLTFKKSPDYEKPGDADGDNVYEITVSATDAVGRMGARDVTVKVTNVEEDGVVTLSPTQHRVGVEITATLKDDDGGVYGEMWQWRIGSGAASTAPGDISGANSATYTPKAGDVDGTLTATVTYRDAAGGDEADSAVSTAGTAVLLDTRNKAPVFKDSKGNTITMAERSVDEDAMGVTSDNVDTEADVTTDNVGGTIRVDDPNIATGAQGDSLAFSLSGPDASKFLVRQPDNSETGATRNVQIEVKGDPKLDYETKDTYMVTLTATDDYGVSADLDLTINITDVNDAPNVTGSGEVEYAENGMGSVATYTAVDPEGAAITSWTLDGDDADDFKIEDGVLSFKKSPNYEKGTDGDQNNDGDTDDTGEEASDNIYMVTVQATDATKRVGMKEVTVEVTNVEEGGSMRLSAVQPQAGTSFYVIDEDEDADATGTQIKDEDGVTSSIKWQWSRSRSKTTGFADIDKATNPAYTPKDTDSGYYLRVTASYTDREGPDKSARAISSYAVQLAPSNNAAPKFDDDQDPDTTGDQADAPRSIAENTPKGVDIGSPVEAEDLNPGKLTYTLEGTNDEDHFDIDRKTGQLKTKTKLDREDAEDLTDRDGNADGLQLQVTVRATDPSGDPHDATATDRADYSATVNVLITVEDLAEDPQITASETDNMLGGFAEETAMTTAIATFEAVVEDSGSVNRWSLTGPDAGKFDIAEPDNATDLDTVLTFKKSPDYEKPGDADGDNVYEITVRATDAVGRTGARDVTVKVTNVEEDGVVTLSPTQHRVGVEITATLKDDDGGVYGEMWQWRIGSGAASTAPGDISGANSATYTPKAGDVDGTLTATVTYRDAAGGDEADSAVSTAGTAVLLDTRNKAPVFKDSKGNTITMAERSVDEDAMGVTSDNVDTEADVTTDNVGGTIRVDDPNIATGAQGDSLAFSLSGPDASKFLVRQPDNSETGATRSVQIEVKAGTKFDYETDDTYMVTLTATDDYGETADLELTINITDVNDAPVIMVGGLAISGMTSVEYAENGTGMVAMYSATGPESANAMWSLEGDDAGAFSIGSSSGVLTFVRAPDYETPADANMDNTYMVTVMADDGTYMAMRDVVVTVTNVEDTTTVIGGTLLDRYDTDVSGRIDKDELANGVFDYNIEGTLDKADLVELIFSYEIG